MVSYHTAAPGEPVKVFGITLFNKPGGLPRLAPRTDDEVVEDYCATIPRFEIVTATTTDIETAYSGGRDQVAQDEAGRNALRQRTGVRALKESEDGRPLWELPEGIYGFEVPWRDVRRFDVVSLSTNRRSTAVLEIHKSRTGAVYEVGYVPQETLVQLQDAARGRLVIAFSPEFRGENHVLVALPVTEVIEGEGPNEHGVMYLTLCPSILNPSEASTGA